MAKTPEELYPDGPVETLLLSRPIPRTDPPLRELKFWRRVKVGDLEWMEDNGYEGTKGTRMLLSRICLVPSATLLELDAYDLGKADRVLKRFLYRGPSGENESSGSPSSPESSGSE